MVPHIVALPEGNGRRRLGRRRRRLLLLLPLPRGRLQRTWRRPESIRRAEHTEQPRLRTKNTKSANCRKHGVARETFPGGIVRKFWRSKGWYGIIRGKTETDGALEPYRDFI